MGIDDAVALTLVLQAPSVRILSVVTVEGVASRDRAVEFAARILDEFNRGDIPLYAPARVNHSVAAPPFRMFAEKSVAAALRGRFVATAIPFCEKAYVTQHRPKPAVLALGPLTNLASVVRSDEARKGIGRIIIQGSPDGSLNWNIRHNPQAFLEVQRSGIPLEFVESGTGGAKPRKWQESGPLTSPPTSLAEAFLGRLLSEPDSRRHYAQGVFASFTDELPVLFCVDDRTFERAADFGGATVYRPANPDRTMSLFHRLLSEGRQRKDRVILVEGSLPDDILQPDLRARKASILARNGESEWFAQLLMNELHEHLGLYSVIGVKMGLRAAELLNAPQHGMRVVSFAPPQPPVSCLNDGIIVATGSTPGRALFLHEPGPATSTRVSFSYNSRQISLVVKDEYRKKVQAIIEELRKTHTLEDAEYWDGVRKASLDIWETWHRRELFDLVERSPIP